MQVKLEVKQDYINPNLKVIYTNNEVTPKLLDKVKEILEEEKEVRISFDVIGSTLHTILSNQLKEELKDKYKVEIKRYECKVSKG